MRLATSAALICMQVQLEGSTYRGRNSPEVMIMVTLLFFLLARGVKQHSHYICFKMFACYNKKKMHVYKSANLTMSIFVPTAISDCHLVLPFFSIDLA